MPLLRRQRRQPDNESTTKRRLHIGLDVGTHWTKAVWKLDKPGDTPASTKEPKNRLLHRLNAIYFQGRPQVKTQAVWDREERRFKFGDSVDEYFRRYPDRPESDRITFLKLGICEISEDNPDFVRGIQDKHNAQLAAIARLRPQGEPMKKWSFSIDYVILKYLEWVFKHIEESIKHAQDIQDGRLREYYDISCTACVPAQYSPELKGKWEELFKAAGSTLGFVQNRNNVRSHRGTGLYLASEPEAAAALDIQAQLEKEGDEDLASKVERLLGPMIIVDISHGTGDYGLYIPKKITPFVRMDEGICPTGDFFGSMNLDQEFRKQFCTRFEDELPIFLAQQGKEDSEINREILIDGVAAEFERSVKKKFGNPSAESEPMLINIPHIRENLQKGIRHGCVEMPKESIEAIFRTLLNHIAKRIGQLVLNFEAIQKQAKSELKVTRIVLFGGTSGNQHVLQDIRSRFLHRNHPRYELTCSYAIDVVFLQTQRDTQAESPGPARSEQLEQRESTSSWTAVNDNTTRHQQTTRDDVSALSRYKRKACHDDRSESE